MSEAGFTFAGTDPGAVTGRYGAGVLLEDRKMSLVPTPGRRVLSVPSRPGSWDFGTELGERAIDLDLAMVWTSLTTVDAALAALADLFDPTEGSQQLIFDTLSDRYFLARLTGEPIPTLYPGAARVSLSMRCSDPFAYSTALYTVHGGSITLTGFSAYRQAPEKIGWNLVKNGGTVSTVHLSTGANPLNNDAGLPTGASVVSDATSVTGYAIRLIASAVGGPQAAWNGIPVEAGKAYSWAIQSRSDGTMNLTFGTYWCDAAGAFIAEDASGMGGTGTGWVETVRTNRVAPGNARWLRIFTYPAAAGIAFVTALRVKQQTTQVAAWSAADQQTLTQKGLAIYEAATNLLTNGNIETALSGSVSGFDDQFATLNAWTLVGPPTLAANVVTIPVNGSMQGGHSEWWDFSAGSQIRFRLSATTSVVSFYVRWIDANNWVRWRFDSGAFYLDKTVAGVATSNIVNFTQALAAATWYWFMPTITGTSFALSLNNDSAGAVGTVLNAGTSGTVADAALATGSIKIVTAIAAIDLGGVFADVFVVKIPAPPGWTPVNSGTSVGAFCVSKTTKFSGTYSLSVYVNHTSANCWWAQTPGNTATTHTISVRQKTNTSVAAANTGAGPYMAGVGASYVNGVRDWEVLTVTGVATLNALTRFGEIYNVTGTVWWDLAWVAQQAYDTGNADPSGQAYVPTGARAVSNVDLPLPSGLDLSDFSMVGVYRPDHAYIHSGVTYRMLFAVGVDANHFFRAFTTITTGHIFFEKSRAAVTSSVTDAAVTAYAAGDTVVWGVRFSTASGMTLWVSKNGGPVATYTVTTPEAKLAITTAATSILLGRDHVVAGRNQNGTTGIVRILRGGLTDAQVSALVAAPYAAQNELTELDVWRFEDGVVQENYGSNTLDVDVGGTYKALPTIDLTSGGSFGPGNMTVTDESGRVLTWNGSLVLNDVLSIESETLRVRKNGVLSMSGVQAGSKWPELLPAQENNIVIGGSGGPPPLVKAIKATWRNRWL